MATEFPKRPEALALWSRAPMPADLASPTGARQERFVHAVAEAMERPLRVRDRRFPTRRPLVAAVAAAALLLMTVGVVFAHPAGAAFRARISAMFRSAPATPPNGNVGRAPSPTPTSFGASSNVSSPGEDAARLVESPAPSSTSRSVEAPGRARPSTAPNDNALAIQNRLFASAMNARERGDASGALRTLDELIRRYPASPLAQDAHVERFRTLEQMGDREGAARGARRYLALYANGFAREEARTLALETTR